MSSTPTHHLHPSLPAQSEALNLEVKAGSIRDPSIGTNNGNNRDTGLSSVDVSRVAMEAASRKMMEDALGVPSAKRFLAEEERYLLGTGLPSAHIKISSRGR